MEQSSNLGGGMKCGMLEVRCVVFVRLVCHSARQTRPGLERLVYHPKNPTQRGMHPGMGSRHGRSHPGMGSTTWCPAWGTRSVHMGLTLAHPAHPHARAREVRVSLNCEPLPSRRNASDVAVDFTLAPH
jgi:hypothetical protein